MGCRTDSLTTPRERILYDIRHYLLPLAGGVGVMLLLKCIFGTACPFQFLLGLPCPGCGLTRATLLMLRGHFEAAFTMHPLVIPVLSLLFSFLPIRYFYPKGLRFLKICGMILILALILVYILRMMLFFPGEEPICYYDGIIGEWIKTLFQT